MKTAKSTQIAIAAATVNPGHVQKAVLEAMGAVDDARQKCLAAGQLLNDLKDAIGHGKFVEFRREYLPNLSDDTCERWQRAAANVARALPAPSLEVESEVIPLGEILSTPDDELPASALEWKQQWFAFTQDKTIRDCCAGVFVDGDESHRIDRAINGKTKGGASGDRKDFPLFVAVKLKDMGAHFSHWEKMNPVQKTELQNALRAAITGDAVTLRKRTFNFAIWPREVCELALEVLRERMKGAQ